MKGNFDGGLIETSSVILIINKLKLYIENEEVILNNITKTLDMLENYYSSDNKKILDNKKKNLYDSLNTMLENKKQYVEFLTYVVNSYLNKDESTSINFNDIS